MPNNLQTLENEIRSKLPRLMELSAGCDIMHNELTEHTYTTIDNHYCPHLYSYQYSSFRTLEFTDLKNFTILGHPITLTNVLEWLKGLEKFTTDLGYFEYVIERDNLLENWNLSKNLLREQSTELIDSLFNLIEKR
jgi:hypothetical protein